MCFTDISLILVNFKSLCCAASHMEKVANFVRTKMGKCITFCPSLVSWAAANKLCNLYQTLENMNIFFTTQLQERIITISKTR